MFAVDSETCLFRPGCMAPPLVCVSWADKQGSGLAHWTESRERLEALFAGPAVGQNIAYDTCVFSAQFPDLMPAIFRAYAEDRITDTKLRQQLLDIAHGRYRGGVVNGTWRKFGYSLDDMCRRFFGASLDKTTWRTGYAELRDLPLSEWPEGARTYAQDDALWTLRLHDLQEADAGLLRDQYRQARAAFALALSSAHGLRTDPKAVAEFTDRVREDHEALRKTLQAVGILRADGTRDTKAAKAAMLAACEAQGLEPRRTKTGDVCMDREACEAVDDSTIRDYSAFLTLGKVLSTDCAMLESATVVPVHPSYDLAESGRTTCSKPNIQNVSTRKGSREPYVPRTGKVFAQADFGGLELATLAQVCKTKFGYSRLADTLNEGKDPHTQIAAAFARMSYDEAKARIKEDDELKRLRKLAKAFNFGLPGGLGCETFRKFAKKSAKLEITPEEFYERRQLWLYAFPEVQELFAWASAAGDQVEQLFTGRFRGGVTYCSALNTTFQGLGSDCAKEALWRVTQACYLLGSVLYGARVVAFIHDEIILEVADGPQAHDCALELERLMVEGARQYLPDVVITAPPVLMRCWSKDAIAVYQDGRLVPWDRHVHF